MAHLEQKQFFNKVKFNYPDKFKNCNVLDIGSLDINGNNRFLFENYKYIGVDIGPGNNVDVVSKGHEYKSDILFDVVISSECFEHDIHYIETIKNCINLTKPGGLFTFTCASTGRPEHGTKRTSPADSPFTAILDEWSDYYKNLTEDDIKEIVNFDEIFSEYGFEYNPNPGDLYFWGIKKNI
jgi:SAM-dependent methyltransferase